MNITQIQKSISVYSFSSSTTSTSGTMFLRALRFGNTVFLCYNGTALATTTPEIRFNYLPIGFRPVAQTIDLAAIVTGTQSLYFTLVEASGSVRMARRQITAAGGFVSTNLLGTENFNPGIKYFTNDPMPTSNLGDPFIRQQMPLTILSGMGGNSSGATSDAMWRFVKLGPFVFLTFYVSVSGTSTHVSTYAGAIPSAFIPKVTVSTLVSTAGSQNMYFADSTATGAFQVYRRQATAAGGLVTANFVGNEGLAGGLLYHVP